MLSESIKAASANFAWPYRSLRTPKRRELTARPPGSGRIGRSALSAHRRPGKPSSVILCQDEPSEGGGGKLAESLGKVATCASMSTTFIGAPGPSGEQAAQLQIDALSKALYGIG